jgi:lipoate-protein ligase A
LDDGRAVLNPECSSSRTWLLLDSGPGEAAFNMAMDDALLQAMPRLQKPVLRWYAWTERAATFGYFQKHADVESATLLRPLIRRPTGGGIVPHDADWTYSLAFPAIHEWYSLKAVESYRRVHEWICSAFARLNVATELAPCRHKSAAGQCFIGHEQFDLLWHGRKIAGAAQRRSRAGLLIQGSVQPPPALLRTDWQAAMRLVAVSQWGVEWTEFKPDAGLRGHAAELKARKFAQTSHNRKR